MRLPVRISPSILSADFSRLGAEVEAITAAGADHVHVDVMDGHFVPNITIGPLVVKALRPHSPLPFDVHLMIAPVELHLAAFAGAGANSITIHIEAEPDIRRSLAIVRGLGKRVGVTLKPAGSVSGSSFTESVSFIRTFKHPIWRRRKRKMRARSVTKL